MLIVPPNFADALRALAEETAAAFDYDTPCVFEVLDVVLESASLAHERAEFAFHRVAVFGTEEFADEPIGPAFRYFLTEGNDVGGWIFLRRSLGSSCSQDTPGQLRGVALAQAAANSNNDMKSDSYPLVLSPGQLRIVTELAERWRVTPAQALGAALEIGLRYSRNLLHGPGLD